MSNLHEPIRQTVSTLEWRGERLMHENIDGVRHWYGNSGDDDPFVAVMVWGHDRGEACYRPKGKRGLAVKFTREPGETRRAACERGLIELEIGVSAGLGDL